MRILITAPGEFVGNDLVPGKYYECELADSGSAAQNNAYWALVSEYYRSGLFSYPAKNIEELHSHIKKNLGLGFESYVYVEERGNGLFRGEAKSLDDIPSSVAKDGNGKKMIWGRLKSWSKYGKKARRETIDGLIAEMDMAGVRTKKYFEILDGMRNNNIWETTKEAVVDP
jgi:hypothetical protein